MWICGKILKSVNTRKIMKMEPIYNGILFQTEIFQYADEKNTMQLHLLKQKHLNGISFMSLTIPS